MVAELLRADEATVAGLAGAIQARTSGNPYQTVELLNALRRDGLLTADGRPGGGGMRRPCARTWAGSR